MTKSAKGKTKPKTSGPMIDDDSVWVLGTHMTKFGRYPDHDAVDLASMSAIAALQDGGVTIHDTGVVPVLWPVDHVQRMDPEIAVFRYVR